MSELAMLRSTDSLIATVAWQATAFLALGLAAGLALKRRPARGHQALLLAILAAIAAPALTEAGRRLGWGMWAPGETPAVVAPATSGPALVATTPARPPREESFVKPLPDDPRPAAATTFGPPPPAFRVEDVDFHTPTHRPATFPWRGALLATWALASAMLLGRLITSFAAGFRLASRAERLGEGDPLRMGLEAAARGLGLPVAPAVARSADVRCPAVWCWGRRPLLLLPEGEGIGVDWAAVFRHELAHWRRRDHLSMLASELLACVLPWHPLAWAARARLAQLAELACDDWVLAGGTPASDYAATLLGLAPQDLSPALAAVSGRSGLRGRIVRILSDHRPEPSAGRRWSAAACAAVVLAASLAALAQARPGSPKPDEPGKPAEAPKEDAPMTTVAGKVLDPDGKPVKGATVYWIGSRKPKLPYVALPRGDRDGIQKIETITKAETGADGGFKLAAVFDGDRYSKYNGVLVQLVVKAPGLGMLGRSLEAKDMGRELNLQLDREEIIRGRLLTPEGMPAAGVRVVLEGFQNEEKKKSAYLGRAEFVSEIPEYWPRPTETDADGRFTIGGVPVGVYATVGFRHPDYAADDVTVNTIPERTISAGLRGFDIEPVEPSFEYALEPARPVEGRVTDKASGGPLADVCVEVVPMRRHGGQTFSTRTAADGGYRVSGDTTDGIYFIHAYPPADSGYLALSERRTGSEVVGRTLKVDMALDRGRLVSGRVVDRDSKAPVAGAAVVYQPDRKNPNNKRDYDLRNPVLTDADGRFRITALPGEGFLAVEAPTDAYVRTSGKDPNRSRGVHPHGLLTVDVPKDGEVPAVEIPLRKGTPLEARVLDPDGRPVEGFLAMYPGINACLIDDWDNGKPFADGLFRIPGADPEQTYRVFFISIARRLGAVAELKLDPSGKPLDVRLQPTATIKGRVVESGGGPPREAQAYPRMLLRPERKEYTRDELFNDKIACFYSNFISDEDFYFHRDQPDKDGNFSFEAMIPGVGFNVVIGAAGRDASALVWDLKPGEVRDLGTLTLKETPR